MFAPASFQVAPPSVLISNTEPSKVLSVWTRCQKVSVADVAAPGMATGLVNCRRVSVTVLPSGAKAEKVPVWLAVLTAAQAGVPSAVKMPRVPLSKPSVTVQLFGVAVGVGVLVGGEVGVGVEVGPVSGSPWMTKGKSWTALAPVSIAGFHVAAVGSYCIPLAPGLLT